MAGRSSSVADPGRIPSGAVVVMKHLAQEKTMLENRQLLGEIEPPSPKVSFGSMYTDKKYKTSVFTIGTYSMLAPSLIAPLVEKYLSHHASI